MNILNSITADEGFVSKPYIDPVAKKSIPKDELAIIEKHWNKLHVTFGHGLTYITEKESVVVVQGRINHIDIELRMARPVYGELSPDIRNVLIEMSYQMGVNGCLNFTKMWEALEAGNYGKAADEGRDSLWYRQTPVRVEKLMSIVELG